MLNGVVRSAACTLGTMISMCLHEAGDNEGHARGDLDESVAVAISNAIDDTGENHHEPKALREKRSLQHSS